MQPESLGEGEEAAALGHLPPALGREEAGGQGRRASRPLHSRRRIPGGERRGPGVRDLFRR